ncbi:ABC transporter substrate-binding protein [Mesorhizobium sp.]|uniref:ABC transporter substrate-binding protein n=1 Tax=Mesorhizobium sp. TaxID=1871066 RepID=UPI000FE53B0E|nr:ABC transporter substrate-binding protein [Mesorhizobium sp.]RWF99155.1 MAG: ABC transporter substrate-binding protein [Mesorhizobium sp.]RWG94357.1 MAG: ABC transporter substrate-binding protein [Mesorhizobium sp.]TIN37914.1 MAG: ABC transporter substrate-binding protein [Mesorhizobium sp.]TIR89542.1 MAG: ABC transporter substrate-binding protein [Mesorhizobium sp.]
MSDNQKDSLAQLATHTLDRRAFMIRASALGLGGIAANSLFAKHARAATPKKGGALKIGLTGGGATDTLDPALAGSQVPFHLCHMFGEPLVEVSPQGHGIEPRLATEYSSNPDATVWTFKIRKGVKFHDGSTLQPDDVAATLKRHIDKNSKSVAYGILRGITNVEAKGDDVVITVASPTADFPYLMTSYNLVIQPKGGVGAPAAGIGTSAYKLVRAEAGVGYQFAKFDDYWDDSRGHFDTVELLVINDATARSSALRSGQIHMMSAVPPKVAKLLASTNVDVKNVAGRGHYAFSMMCDKAPFDNNDLRLALKFAINRKEILEKVIFGYGSVGNDSPINPTYPLYDTSIPQREFDLDKARFHYKKSGHDGSPIVLSGADVAFPGAMDAEALFQQTAQAAGIPLQIHREPNDGYWSDVWLKKPFVATYWNGRAVQDQMYSTAYIVGSDYNETHFNNPKFDDIIKAARGETDEAKRKALYSEAFYLVRDEGGAIVPIFNDFVDGISKKIGGWVDDVNFELMNGYAAHKCWFEG